MSISSEIKAVIEDIKALFFIEKIGFNIQIHNNGLLRLDDLNINFLNGHKDARVVNGMIRYRLRPIIEENKLCLISYCDGSVSYEFM